MSTQGNINTAKRRYWPQVLVFTGLGIILLLGILNWRLNISSTSKQAIELVSFCVAGLTIFFSIIIISDRNLFGGMYKKLIGLLIFGILFLALHYSYNTTTVRNGIFQWQRLFFQLAAYLFSFITGAVWHLFRNSITNDQSVPDAAYEEVTVETEHPVTMASKITMEASSAIKLNNNHSNTKKSKRKNEFRKISHTPGLEKSGQVTSAIITASDEQLLEKEFDQIRLERTKQFEAGLQAELQELRDEQKQKLEEELSTEREEIRALQLDLLERQLADEQEAVRLKQREQFEKMLDNDHQALAAEKLKLFEVSLVKQQEIIRANYEQQIEKELKEKQALVRKQQEQLVKEEAKKQQLEITAQKARFAEQLKADHEDMLEKQRREFDIELQKHSELKKQQKQLLTRELEKEKYEIRSRHQQQFDSELAVEQEQILQRQESIRQKLIERQQTESDKQWELFENSLLIEQSAIRLKRQQQFEQELLKEEEVMRQKRLEAFEQKIKNEQSELAKKHAETFEQQMLNEQEYFKKQQTTAFEISLQQEQEQIRAARLKSFENSLVEEQRKLQQTQLALFETALKKEQEKIKAEQKALLELELNEYRIATQERHKEIQLSQPGINSKLNTVEPITPVGLPEYLPSNSTTEEKALNIVISSQRPVIILNGVTIYLQIAAATDIVEETIFIYAAPLEMKLGDYFNHFLNARVREMKNDIEIADSNRILFQWTFYRKGLLSTKKLDPALSLAKNKIQETSIIIARRVTP